METLNAAANAGNIDVEPAPWLRINTREVFEQWLLWVSIPPTPVADLEEPVQPAASDVVFDGLLRVDGLVTANIRSAHGTLVMTEDGHVTANVDVRAAYIDGFLEGSLRATEEVVLNPGARVSGDIYTPSLSIRNGAVFEGKSFVLERSIYEDFAGLEQNANLPDTRLVGAYRQQMRRDPDPGLQFSYKARQ